MRDMIPPEDRSIRNIPIPVGHRPHPHALPVGEMPQAPMPPRPVRPRRRRSPGRFILWALIVIVVCAALGAGLSYLFGGATVHAEPRTQAVTLPASTTIPAALNASVGTLAYQTLAATEAATTTVPATGTARVSRQATGVITITSTYSASQRLIANTRLAVPDGKIYRLSGSVTVPAATLAADGTVTAPASVTATVNADSPGASYNRTGATTFTFPAFVGDPRQSKFSAKSEGDIKGGFVGDEPSVAAADLAAAKTKLQAQLESAVGLQLGRALPEGFTAIPGTLNISYSEVAQSAGDNKTATLVQSATATGVIVRVGDLATAIARKTIPDYQGEAVAFGAQGTLVISAASTTKPTDAQMTLVAGGSTTLVWQFDPNALKQAMLGKDKAQFQTVIDSFAPAIASATVSLKPFWIKNFPSDPDKITVEIKPSQ